MNRSPIACGLATAALGLGMTLPGVADADFIEDGKADLELRNFYFNSDYHQPGAAQSKRDEWAQGFILDYQSGFTEGPVGFGVDALGLLGLKLDSGPDRQNTGLLPVGADHAPDDYSKLGLTAKIRISKSVLRIGTLTPRLPTVIANDSRLLPQMFRGAQLTSTDIDGLTFNGGQFTSSTDRNASGHVDLAVTGKGIKGAQPSDEFNFAGGDYKWNKNITTGYHYAELTDNYLQQVVTLSHVFAPGAEQTFKTDLRYAASRAEGDTNVDNRAIGARMTYGLGGHAFGVAYQKMKGETGFPYLDGTDPYLVNYVMIAPDYANVHERSWQARYDYDFAAVGLPGLTFMTRYLKGDQFERAGAPGTEWERNTDIGYVVQSGPLKNVEFKWRNGSYRSNGGNDIDQNRLILSYTVSLF